MEYLTKHLNGLAIPDWTSDSNEGLPKVVVQCFKQKVIYFSVINKKDPQRNGEGRIRVVGNGTGDSYLSFTLSGVDMDFELDYNMYSKPDWIHDKGKGRITIRGMTISMRLIPEVFPGGRITAKVIEDPS